MKIRINALVRRARRMVAVLLLMSMVSMCFAVAPEKANISISFYKAEIPVVLKALSDISGANIVVAPLVKGEITVTLRGVSLDEAMSIIVQMSSLSYSVQNGVYIVSTKDAAAGTAAGTAGGTATVSSAFLVVDLLSLTPANATTLITAAYPDVTVKTFADNRLVLSGPTDERLTGAATLLKQYDSAGNTSLVTRILTLQWSAPEDAIMVLAGGYKDLTVKQMKDNRLVLTGEMKRVEDAIALIKHDVDVQPAGQPAANSTVQDIVALHSLAAVKAREVLNIKFSDVAVTHVDDMRILITGRAERLTEAKAFLAQIDTAAVVDAEMSYQLKVLSPTQTKQYLETTYGKRGLTVAFAPNTQGGELTGNPYVAPGAAWTSTVLLLRGAEPVVKEALAALEKLDVGETANGGSAAYIEKRCSVTHVMAAHVINRLLEQYDTRGLLIITAPAPITTVKTLTSGKMGTIIRRGTDGSVSIPDDVNDFILAGPERVVNAALATWATLDVGPEIVDHTYSVRYLRTAEVKTKLDERFAAQGLQVQLAPAKIDAGSAGGGGAASTAASSAGSTATAGGGETDTLLLRGPEPVVLAAETLLRSLDTDPLQVNIKVRVISVDVGEEKTLGIQWPTSLSANFSEAAVANPFRLGAFLRSPISFNASLSMLEAQNKAKVISEPKMTIQDGREAKIHVGRNIFYETVTGFSNTGPVFSPASVNSGVTLQVRPRVTKDGYITLEIDSSVTDPPKFNTGTSGAQLPDLAENSTRTTITVRDGETSIIGGLIQTRETETRKAVPILGRLPLVGGLFRYKSVQPQQTELIILVTPVILRPYPPAAATDVTAPIER